MWSLHRYHGVLTSFVELEDLEPKSVRRGWQHEAASRVDRHFKEHVLFDRSPPRDRAQVRSQAGRRKLWV